MKLCLYLLHALLLILSNQLSCIHAKQGGGYDLPKSDPIRIGIKRRSNTCLYVQ